MTSGFVDIKVDESLLTEALRLGEHQTQKAIVEEALREYIQRRERLKIMGLFGSIDFDPEYDYKRQRHQT